MPKNIALKFKRLKLDDQAVEKYKENINCLFVSRDDFPKDKYPDNKIFIASFKKQGIVKKIRLVISEEIEKGQMHGNIILAEYLYGSKYNVWTSFLNKKHNIQVDAFDKKNTSKIIELDIDIDIDVTLDRYKDATSFDIIDKNKILPIHDDDSDSEYDSESDLEVEDSYIRKPYGKDVPYEDLLSGLFTTSNSSQPNHNSKAVKIKQEEIINLIKKYLKDIPIENGFKFVIPIDDKIFINTIGKKLFLTCKVEYGSLENGNKNVIVDQKTKVYPYITSTDLSSQLEIDKPFINKLYKKWDKYNVGGMDKEIKEINEQILAPFMLNKEQQRSLGIKPPKGVLLYGEPGTGKTHLCKAIADQLQEGLDGGEKKEISEIRKSRNSYLNRITKANNNKKVVFKIIKSSDIKDKYTGVPAQKIKAIFEEPRKNPNDFYILFFDEAEGLFATRQAKDSEGDYSGARLSAFLPYLSGSESDKYDNVLIILATNLPENLDSALKRSGRVDVKIAFTLPNLEARKKILEVHTKKISLDKDVDLDQIAKITTGFSGADIENLVDKAKRKAIQENTYSVGNFTYFKNLDKPKRLKHIYLLESVKSVLGDKRPDLAKYYRIVKEPFAWYSEKLKNHFSKICNNIEYLEKSRLLTIPIFGSKGTGKTATAVNFAIQIQKKYDYNIEFIQAQMLFKKSTTAKIEFIEAKFREALSKKKSVIVVDNIEDIYNGVPELKKYLQRILTDRNNISKENQLVIIATARKEKYTKLFGEEFDYEINLKPLSKKEEIKKVLEKHHLNLDIDDKGVTKEKTIKQWVRFAEFQSKYKNINKRKFDEVRQDYIEKFENKPKKRKDYNLYM